MGKPLIWSYGGGTQSIAIAVLIAQGRLPKPERIVIADTGRERTSTWEYLDNHIQPLLGSLGLRVEVIPRSWATVDLYDSAGVLMPMYVNNGTGRRELHCSDKWKKRVVRRYLRAEGYGPKKPVLQWLGFSLDELGRCKPSDVDWCEYAWPLIFDTPMRRSECSELVVRYGLPKPPKSSCWMCPFMRNPEWLELKEKYPQDWQRAITLEAEIRGHENRPDMTFHKSGALLPDADLTVSEKPPLPMFGEIDDCESGYCMV